MQNKDDLYYLNDLYLCCNIINESYVDEIKLPVLRSIKRTSSGYIQNEVSRVIWLKLNREFIPEIRLYITNNKGQIVSLPENKLNCTLLFLPAP